MMASIGPVLGRERVQFAPRRSLLEREAELRELEAGVRAAAGGAGCVALLEGPAGIGKSSLLEELVRRSAGVAALTARSSALETDLPFGVAVRLLEQAVLGRPGIDATHVWDGPAELAAPLFRGLTGPREPRAGEVFPLLHGLYWLTANLADHAPLLVCVDDAQWADRPSLRFLAYLAERLDGLPVCLVVATRPRPPGDGPEALDALRARCSLRVEPTRLSPAAVADLVRTRFEDADDAFCQACADATGGNPLLVVELVGEVERRGMPPRAGVTEELMALASRELSRRTAARLDELPAPAGDVAICAAVLGPDAELRHVAALAGVGLDEASAAAGALTAAGLFSPDGPPALAHPLLAAATLESVPAARRAALHLEAARLLHRAGLPAARVAAHLDEAPPAGEGWAFEALRDAAARAMEEGAPETAARWLRRSVSEAPTRFERSRALAGLGRAKLATGDSDAPACFSRAADIEPDADRRARLRLEEGRALGAAGELPRSCEVLLRAREELPAGAGELRAELEAAWVLLARHVPPLRDEALRLMGRLVERPGPAGGPGRELLAAAANQAVFAGEPRERVVALARRALHDGSADGAGDQEDVVWAVGLAALGWSDELQLVEEIAGRRLDDARRRGSIAAYATASYARSYALLHSGRVVEAVADCRQAIDARPDAAWILFPFACVQLACAELERDDAEAAEAAIERCEPDARWAEAPVYILIQEARGRLALARGDPDRALALLLEAGTRAAAAMMPNPAVVQWRSYATRAAIAVGAREQARELAREELELARRFGAGRAVAGALRSSGLAAPSLDLLGQAAGALEGTPFVPERARTLVDLGAAQRRDGRRAEARDSLRLGMELAERCGALALRRRAGEELEAAGGRARRDALSGVDSLTPGELRVARMAAGGMTNRQIAQALFVTVKAVQWHLRNTYRKLAVAGREELAEVLGPPGDASP